MAASDPVPTLIHGLVEAIIASLRAKAESKGLKLDLARDPEDIIVRVDRKLLGRVVIDLIHASIEDTVWGAIRVSISRSADADRRMIEISVARVGEGIGATAATALASGQDAAGTLGGRIFQTERPGGSTYVLQVPAL